MQIHVVQPGETLYAIGREYETAPELIARYNGLQEPYDLAVGQALLILRPLSTYIVREGDSLTGIAARFGVTVDELYRNNPNLSGTPLIYPGQVLVIRLEQERRRAIEVSGYAYPFVDEYTLRGILPYVSRLVPFTYGFDRQSQLVELDDGALLRLADEFGVGTLMHLSTLSENGSFSTENAQWLLSSPERQETLARNAVEKMLEKGYQGIDLDFEFLGAELADAYADFAGILRSMVNDAGGILITALAPKTSAEQRGLLYEGHDYRRLGENSDAVLLMTYEWGYTYGPPMAVAPLASVRRVVEYAVSEIPPEKILLGFPNYAYDWALPYEAGQSRARLIGNEEAVRLAVRTGSEIEYDGTAQTPWFSYTTEDGMPHEVWFEDPRSSLAKFELMEEYGLRGLGYWNFMRPYTANFSLQNYLFNVQFTMYNVQ